MILALGVSSTAARVESVDYLWHPFPRDIALTVSYPH